MISLMADENYEGQLDRVMTVLTSEEWGPLWELVAVPRLQFSDVGLQTGDIDTKVWDVCQQRRIVLFTGNRNHDGVDSLDAAPRPH